MDIRRCLLVMGAIAVSLFLASLLGIFSPAALLPSRIVAGGTRVFVALALVLVAGMVVASTCRRP